MEDEETSEIERFQNAMTDDNLEVQIESIRKLPAFAANIGPIQTREILLPFVFSIVEYATHDEVLINIAEELKYFVPLVGGKEYAECIIEILVKICSMDDPLIRNKGIETIKEVCYHFNVVECQEILIPIVENFASTQWYASKCSAAALIPICYVNASEEKKQELRDSFKVLIQEESPILKRSVACSMLGFIKILEKEFIKEEFIPILLSIAEDPTESVRELSVELAIEIMKKIDNSECSISLFETVIEPLHDNSSFKIRQYICSSIHKILSVLQLDNHLKSIMEMQHEFVKDTETDVRVTAAKAILTLTQTLKELSVQNFEDMFEKHILPDLDYMTKDNSEVRLALSENLLKFSTLLSENSFKKYILPSVVQFLENEPCMAIQENILQTLNYLPPDLDIKHSFSSIDKVIENLINNSQLRWRTRRSLLLGLVHVSRFSSNSFFNDHIKMLYSRLISDSVYAIRRTTPVVLPIFATHYGLEWTYDNILPYFLHYTRDARYLYRYIPLHCMNELISPTLDKQVVESKFDKYLKDFKQLVNNNDENIRKSSCIVLARIRNLFKRIKLKLEEDSVCHLIERNYTCSTSNENLKLYAEETLQTLKQYYQIDAYRVKEKDLTEFNYTYLECILILVYKYFLDIIIKLSSDKVENVQVQAQFSLLIIRKLLEKLNYEMNQPWFKDNINKLEKERLEAINQELDQLLAKKNSVNEDKTSVNEDKTSVNEDKTSVNEGKTYVNEDRTYVNEDRTFVNEDKTDCAAKIITSGDGLLDIDSDEGQTKDGVGEKNKIENVKLINENICDEENNQYWSPEEKQVMDLPLKEENLRETVKSRQPIQEEEENTFKETKQIIEVKPENENTV